jgi:hypothetical protein
MMNANSNTAPPNFASLVRREYVTEQSIVCIDERLGRLRTARSQRVAALKNIRRELVKATKSEPVAVESNEPDRS